MSQEYSVSLPTKNWRDDYYHQYKYFLLSHVAETASDFISESRNFALFIKHVQTNTGEKGFIPNVVYKQKAQPYHKKHNCASRNYDICVTSLVLTGAENAYQKAVLAGLEILKQCINAENMFNISSLDYWNNHQAIRDLEEENLIQTHCPCMGGFPIKVLTTRKVPNWLWDLSLNPIV